MNTKLAMLVLAFAVATTSSTATAQEGEVVDWANKAGAFGVGANTTLGGTNGLNIRTYVTPLFGLRSTIQLGIDSATVESTGTKADISTTVFSVGLYATYKLAYWQRGSLSVLFGGDIKSVSDSFEADGMKTENSATDILLGLGLMGEWFPTQYLSLFAEAGLVVDFIGQDEAEDGIIDNNATDPSGIRLNLASDLWGQAGFTVWFK